MDGASIFTYSRPTHSEVIQEELGMTEDSTGLTYPCVKEEHEEDDDVEFIGDEARRLRKVAATAIYLGQDRLDIQYAVKEICRGMSRPTEGGWTT
jgi:hypothetical protein